MLAANITTTVAVVFAVIFIGGWLVYAGINMRQSRREAGSEIELAANRKPYYDDETLEGPKLERTQFLGVLLLAVLISLVGFTAMAQQVGRWVARRWAIDLQGPYRAALVGVCVVLLPLLLARAFGLAGFAWLAVPLGIVGFAMEYAAWTVGLGATALLRFQPAAPASFAAAVSPVAGPVAEPAASSHPPTPGAAPSDDGAGRARCHARPVCVRGVRFDVRAPGRGHARHVVLLGALAVLDSGLAGLDPGTRALLPDQHPGDRQ